MKIHLPFILIPIGIPVQSHLTVCLLVHMFYVFAGAEAREAGVDGNVISEAEEILKVEERWRAVSEPGAEWDCCICAEESLEV